MLRRLALLASALFVLTACGGDEGSAEGDKNPVEVTVGEAFTWNGFSVADGWTLDQAPMSRGQEQGTMPVIEGEVTNDGEKARFGLLQFTFAQDGKAVATVPCTTGELQPGDSAPMECSGLSSSFPEEYDAVSVSEIKR